jgi:hypothetical protein
MEAPGSGTPASLPLIGESEEKGFFTEISVAEGHML